MCLEAGLCQRLYCNRQQIMTQSELYFLCSNIFWVVRAFGTRKSVYPVSWKTVLRRATTCGRYIQVLPQPDDSSQPAIPLVWHDEDISWLRGTHLEEAVKSRRKDLKRRWREAIEVMKNAGWDVSCYTMFVGF